MATFPLEEYKVDDLKMAEFNLRHTEITNTFMRNVQKARKEIQDAKVSIIGHNNYYFSQLLHVFAVFQVFA